MKQIGRPPCIHGNLCRVIWKRIGYIHSNKCPYGCEFYKGYEEKRRNNNEQNKKTYRKLK